jgi:hypothetical protein
MVLKMELWNKIEININKIYYWNIGNLKLMIKKNNHEWFIGYKYSQNNNSLIIAKKQKESDNFKTDDIKWTRIVCSHSSNTIKLKPMLPDKQIVLESENQIRILPKQQILFFIKIPLFIQIYNGDANSMLLELPTVELSKTWTGTMTSGSPGYSLYDDFKTDYTNINKHNITICPLIIKNNTKNKFFDFNRITLYSQYLNIYKGKKLWANETLITYQEDNKINLNITNKKPQYDKEIESISQYREKFDKNIFKKSFDVIRTIAGI